jgi:putative protein-disulfide isomerase
MQLVYFASPMCSWCWGFSPVIQQLKKSKVVSHIRLVLTPFRIDTSEPMDETLRSYVLGQWQKVHQTTQQPFDFRFAMPADFIYNTRLACMAIKAFGKQLPEEELDYVHALQHAYYTENKDLTKQDSLVNVSRSFAIDIDFFTKNLSDEKIAAGLEQDFLLCQELAVQSYPTLLIEKEGDYSLLANGYTKYHEVMRRIETCSAS